jgi:two-component system cell cycle response regulator CtrA
MRILVVEDTPVSSRSIELRLLTEGHSVDVTSSGEEGARLARSFDYDLLLLDLDLPDMAGLEVVEYLRSVRSQIPIIVVTATNDIKTKVRVLSAGADDYLTKPFHKDELVARINAVIRARRGHAPSILRTGNIALDLDRGTAQVSGWPLPLSRSEYKVLELLCRRQDTPLTTEMCLNHLYKGLSDAEIRAVDAFISNLRNKIAAADKTARREAALRSERKIAA